MKYFFLILILLICCGCGRGKYFISSTFRDGTPPGVQSIDLDSSYRFYIRQVYKDKDANSENILRSNVTKADTANKVRIEIEYLLVSWLHKNVIYITTVPDKFQYYYSTHILPDTIINAYDFSTFHFGKLDDEGEMITFVSADGMKKNSWQIRPLLGNGFPRQIFLRELLIARKDVLDDIILVDRALQEAVVFTSQPNFVIVFNRPGDSDGDAPMKCRLADDKIYFSHDKQGMNLFFRFSCNINAKDSTIGFNFKRTLYDPRPLAGGN